MDNQGGVLEDKDQNKMIIYPGHLSHSWRLCIIHHPDIILIVLSYL